MYARTGCKSLYFSTVITLNSRWMNGCASRTYLLGLTLEHPSHNTSHSFLPFILFFEKGNCVLIYGCASVCWIPDSDANEVTLAWWDLTSLLQNWITLNGMIGFESNYFSNCWIKFFGGFSHYIFFVLFLFQFLVFAPHCSWFSFDRHCCCYISNIYLCLHFCRSRCLANMPVL